MNQASFHAGVFALGVQPLFTTADTRPAASYGVRQDIQQHQFRQITRGATSKSAFFEWLREDAQRGGLPERSSRHSIAERLRSFLLLEDGWDGARAPAPSRLAVDVGHLVLDLSEKVGLDIDRVVPDVEGGLAVYFFGGAELPDGGRQLQLGVLAANDGEALLYIRDRGAAGSKIEEIEPSNDGIAAAVARIRSILHES